MPFCRLLRRHKKGDFFRRALPQILVFRLKNQKVAAKMGVTKKSSLAGIIGVY
jgi:hypothetical protein